MKQYLATLALALMSFVVQAQTMSGNELLRMLTSTETVSRAVGIGYVNGVYDAEFARSHCAPQGVVLKQVIDLVHQDMIRFPTHRHLPASILVATTLESTWPCQKLNKGNS